MQSLHRLCTVCMNWLGSVGECTLLVQSVFTATNHSLQTKQQHHGHVTYQSYRLVWRSMISSTCWYDMSITITCMVAMEVVAYSGWTLVNNFCRAGLICNAAVDMFTSFLSNVWNSQSAGYCIPGSWCKWMEWWWGHQIGCYGVMGHRMVGVGGTTWPPANETLSGWEAAPGILSLLRGGLPRLELVWYTMPVPIQGIGFEKPGIVGV